MMVNTVLELADIEQELKTIIENSLSMLGLAA